MKLFDETPCELGEGAFWHPERQSFMWLDILGRRLFERGADGRTEWELPELTSAMALTDDARMLLSGESGLALFDLVSGRREQIADIASDDPALRSNDGRADPWGGFWHSTMDKQSRPDAGGIWRWRAGELRQLFDGLTTANSICFDRPRARAYFSDTARHKVWVQAVDPQGWPKGERRTFIDLTSEGLKPDGAVTDADGRLWVALWGAGRVDCFDHQAQRVGSVAVPASQVSCPVLGGPDLTALMVTSAWEGMSADDRAADPQAGCCFVAQARGRGLPPPLVRTRP